MDVFNRKYCFIDNWFVRRIFLGLSEDVNLLYRNFLETNLTFSSFAELWRKLKFASIFGEKYVPTELMEYTEGVLHFSKGYLFSHEIKAVVFGIYFVYAIYSKQPMMGRTSKLRLTLTEFRELKSRFPSLLEQKYDNAAEIFLYMFRSSAFLFVASSIQGGIERGFRKYLKCSEYTDLPPREVTDPFDRGLLNSYENVCQLYMEKKKEAFGDSADYEVKSNFLEEMKKRLNDFGKNPEIVTVEPDFELKTDSKDSGHGSMRKEIKSRAFAKGAAEPSTSKESQPRPVKIRRKKQIKIELKAEPVGVTEEEPIDEDVTDSFDTNIFD